MIRFQFGHCVVSKIQHLFVCCLAILFLLVCMLHLKSWTRGVYGIDDANMAASGTKCLEF